MFVVNILTIIFSGLSALEHFYILVLETIITTSSKTSKVFNIPEENLKDKHVSTLLKNQGVYNGLIAVLIIISIFLSIFREEYEHILWLRFLLGYIILVAVYGGITSNIMIIPKQGGLAVIGFVLSFFWKKD
jgi:putative membrane protein